MLKLNHHQLNHLVGGARTVHSPHKTTSHLSVHDMTVKELEADIRRRVIIL